MRFHLVSQVIKLDFVTSVDSADLLRRTPGDCLVTCDSYDGLVNSLACAQRVGTDEQPAAKLFREMKLCLFNPAIDRARTNARHCCCLVWCNHLHLGQTSFAPCTQQTAPAYDQEPVRFYGDLGSSNHLPALGNHCSRHQDRTTMRPGSEQSGLSRPVSLTALRIAADDTSPKGLKSSGFLRDFSKNPQNAHAPAG